jgi:hypothetical protein
MREFTSLSPLLSSHHHLNQPHKSISSRSSKDKKDKDNNNNKKTPTG